MTDLLGLRAEKRGRDVWFHDDDGVRRFVVGDVVDTDLDGAVAAVYEAIPPLYNDWDGARIDGEGTEVYPHRVGAPGYWCWLLDLAVEAGFEC